MNLKKLSSTAARLDTLFRVLQKLVVIAVIIMLCALTALSIANAVNPNITIGTDLNILELGPISFELAETHTPANQALLGYAWCYAAIGVLCAAAIWLVLSEFRKLLAPMKACDPFHSSAAHSFKKLAILSLVLGILRNIGSAVESAVALKAFRLDQLIEGDIVRRITVNFKVELGFVVVFFLLLLMSYIFSYGAELQKLSDETL